MASKVIGDNEICLNDVYYPIKGKVQQTLISTFPGKVVIGDYNKDTEQVASNWIIDDLRGGMLIEEMDESVHADRCWFANAQIRHKGNFVLPQLATSVTKPTVTTVSITNGDMELDANWTGGSQSSAQKHAGTYSWQVPATGDGQTYQNLSWTTQYQSRRFGITGWLWSNTASAVRLMINDGVGTTYSSTYHTGGSGWEQFTISRVLDASATRLRIGADNDSGTATCYLDDVSITFQPTTGTTFRFANFNSNLYMAYGNILTKLNTSTGASFDFVTNFPATITALVTGINDCLYIFLGNDDEYWYMNTSEAFTETNISAAKLGISWQGKLYKMNASGSFWSATTPNSATPTWTAEGTLYDDGSVVENLQISRDADGDSIIYAATHRRYWGYDATNDVWTETEQYFPDHPTGGKGLAHWRDADYISAGLDVIEYKAGSTATIRSIGLSRDDGLPSEYQGEIVMLFGSYNELFALVDSTSATGTSSSSIFSWNGAGWACITTSSNTEKKVTGMIVSSVYAYRVWYDYNAALYYITLDRNLVNPKKMSTFTYNASGFIITPWFDAGWANIDKTLLEVHVYTDDCSADESVVVKYRIDYSNKTVASGWTTLGTITSDGETTYTLASGAGVSFKALQLRLDLARGSTNTNSPIVKWVSVKYLKNLPLAWGWQCTLDCSKEHKGRSPSQLLAAIETAAGSTTLPTFIFRDGAGATDTKYVKVRALNSLQNTGEKETGDYQLIVVEP